MGHASAYMEHGKAFPRQASGLPAFHNNHAFHFENKKIAAWLEHQSREIGVMVTDSTVTPIKGGAGIEALLTPEGERIAADLFVDASGFRSELLGGALEEPFVSYTDSLFCDRAVIGGWPRGDEPIHPYTTAETMDHGWCWQIEHEHFINRGYVYSSGSVGDDEACKELLGKNPKITTTPRVVKFRSGRYRRGWVGNVVAVGNAAGFVEPLEATALQVICVESSALADTLLDSLCDPGPSIIELYNRYNAIQWDDIRDFLAVHYRFNTRLNTPFWKSCRADVNLHGARDLVDFYLENGPSVVAGTVLLHHSNSFRMDGYLVMLIGQAVPHKKPYLPTPAESAFWRNRSMQLAAEAKERGMGVKDALAALRNPNVKWS